MRPKNYEAGQASSVTFAGSGYRRPTYSGMTTPGPKASHKNLAPPRGKGNVTPKKGGKSHNSSKGGY